MHRVWNLLVYRAHFSGVAHRVLVRLAVRAAPALLHLYLQPERIVRHPPEVGAATTAVHGEDDEGGWLFLEKRKRLEVKCWFTNTVLICM